MRPLGRSLVISSAVAAATAAAALYYLLPFCVEPPDISPPPDSAVYDRHGELMGYIAGADGYRCQPLHELPQELARALIIAEDKRFYQHGGVDAAALLRALWQQVSGSGKSGASTISMQVVKMYSPPAPRTRRTKLREMLQARRLEMRHSKHELLLAYLNRAEFSNLCRGAESAARYYFGKGAASLSTPEAALLAALVKAPTRLNPLRHPQAARARRDYLLRRMGEKTTAPLSVAPHSVSAPAMASGRPGRLTLDAALQQRIAAIARDEVEALHKLNVSQAAVVVADNRSGEVLAALPAADPDSPRGGALDGTATPRSAGSTLKPFVYLMAFSHGAWPGTVMADVPTLYSSATGIQAPRNYNERYLGPVSIRRALACSQNIPAMEALERFGGTHQFLALLRRLGFEVQGEPHEYGLGLAIGNAHVTLCELVAAYSTLARNGTRLPLQFHLPLHAAQPEPLLPAQHCYRISHILADRNARATTFGPAPALSFPYSVAAKTGTSSNYRDNWCVGYTAEYTVGVWVGNFDNSPMHNISGVSGAGPIFHRVMALMHETTPATFPERPKGVQEVQIDARTGTLATADTPPDCRVTELATEADMAAMPQAQYDNRGRAVLNARYAEWFASAGLGHLYTLAPDTDTGRPRAILIPSHGTTITLDPTLPNNGSLLELKSTLPAGTTTWRCNSLRLRQRGNTWYAELRPGTHTLHASAPPNLHAKATFHVETL